MPRIYDETHAREIPSDDALSYLKSHGVHYEYWSVEGAPHELRQQDALSQDQQQAILDAFRPELERLSREFGYISSDLIILNDKATPNLEELLANFEREHHHTEDEVRFIVEGEGAFTLTRHGDTFRVLVTPGDLISVPRGTRHFFTLTQRRRVKAIRLFQTREGWTALYEPGA